MEAEQLFQQISQDNRAMERLKYHSLRVMYLVSTFAEQLNCYDEDIRVASLLHDIGKTAISDHILYKQGSLNETEFLIVQSHSQIGYTTIKEQLGNVRSAAFVLHHHERWDGRGYPQRLKGDEISYQGRMIAICDAFDAMTVERKNYGLPGLSYAKAIEELRRCSWKQFDGDLVEHFIEMMLNFDMPPTWVTAATR